MGTILEVEHLIKRYGSLTAVDDVSFKVEEGQFFAFLGPNGAGKSTTINCICTLLEPDGGKINVAYFDAIKQIREVRNNIGIVFQDSMLDDNLTVRENIETRATFYGLSSKNASAKVEEIADMLQIREILNRRYGKLSGGQRRRCDIARALVNTPRLLFLDEPTTGLDPQTRKVVWNIIRQIQKQTGLTVFLTTHYMEESAEADYICVMDHGKLSAKGTPEELRRKYTSDIIKLQGDIETQKQILSENKIQYEDKGELIQIKVESSLKALDLLKKVEPYLTGFEVIRGTMDDAFINITGHDLRED